MKYFFILILILSFADPSQSQDEGFPIVPSPQIVEPLSRYLTLYRKVNIVLKGSERSLDFTATQIAETLKNDLGLSAEITTGTSSKPSIILSVVQGEKIGKASADVNDQAYSLTIDKNGVAIESSTSRGVFYGAMSLIQLLDGAASCKLKCARIIDWPDMKVRGISDDISRGQVSTLDNFKKIIRTIARYKMNVYMPYIEDMLQFPKYPEIGKGRGTLSASEVQELVSYAKKYYVDVIPTFETLAHFDNILVHRQFLKYAEYPGSSALNVSDDSTYIFLDNLLREVFKLFPSDYVNIGGDEAFEVGLGASKGLVQKDGLDTVLADHYKKVYDFCKEHGKKVIMYGDMLLRHPEIMKLLPKDIIISDWQYYPHSEYPSTEIFRDNGFSYYVSPTVWNYETTFPNNINAISDIQYFTRAGLENGDSGMIVSNWGDLGAPTFKELLYLDYAWAAECSWNLRASDISTFTRNFFYDFFGANDARISDIYKTLSNPLNLVSWHKFWRHPFLDFHKWIRTETDNLVLQVEWMNWTLPHVLAQINAVEPEVKKHREQLHILKFIIALGEWYKSKTETDFLLHDREYMKDRKNDNILMEQFERNITSLGNLKAEYDSIWTTYYEKANLQMINDNFERLSEYLGEIEDSLKNGDDTLYSPLIPSKWVYVMNDNGTPASKAEFEKKIDFTEVPDTAYIQLMGNTYARLYINREYVGEVYAQISGSIYVEHQRVKLVDVRKYLRKGENVFLVKAENFSPDGAAGVNIDSYFSSNGKVIRINTDDDNQENSWKGRTEGTNWGSVFSKEYPYPIVAPNFKTWRPSWIEW